MGGREGGRVVAGEIDNNSTTAERRMNGGGMDGRRIAWNQMIRRKWKRRNWLTDTQCDD